MDEDAYHAAAYRCRPSVANTRWYILGVNSATDGICIYTHIRFITIQHNVQEGTITVSEHQKCSLFSEYLHTCIHMVNYRVVFPTGMFMIQSTSKD